MVGGVPQRQARGPRLLLVWWIRLPWWLVLFTASVVLFFYMTWATLWLSVQLGSLLVRLIRWGIHSTRAGQP